MAHFNMWRHLVFHLKLRFAYEALFQNRSQFILQTKQNLILQFLSKIKFQQPLTKKQKQMQTVFNYQIYLTLWDAHMYFFFSYPYSSVCIWKMQEKESLLANLRLTTSQATSNQTAAVYTSPVPREGGENLEGHKNN